ncbi:AB hydrolase superfamily protein YvaM [Vibrio aerogenes CECT 7868]|uniref:AB hydrolase superfamily protein YvaM n=1 Tax=Vibrio aerogenes CECT 7868 TaxID=1216006 RepID=A0A1M5ZXS0_9VIBR|nr:alpha/beta hydrolase [Vibrio aerogenes]SHI29040.1 AB hydrolase superfamily protein YvaM [Vibrio aerogenes CECT 7868]
MKSLFIESCQSFLRYHDIPGDKVPIVFIHGIGCASSSDYPAVAAQLVSQGHRCILVDLLGAGFSDHPAGFSYSVEAHAQVLAELVDAIHLSGFVIFGHSAGGAVATVFASLCVDKVEKLILAEPNLDPGGGFFSCSIAEQSLSEYLRQGHQQKIQDSAASGNDIWAGTMQVAHPIAVHRLACSLVAGSVPTWRTLLFQLSKPRLVLFGEYSLPDPDTERLPQSGVDVSIIPQAGHSMMWDNPVAVAQTIERFMMPG